MRGELFRENDITDLYDFLDIKVDDNKDYEEELNPLLSENIYQLQKHHMVVLEYVKYLEQKNDSLRDRVEYLERLVKQYEAKEKNHENFSEFYRM